VLCSRLLERANPYLYDLEDREQLNRLPVCKVLGFEGAVPGNWVFMTGLLLASLLFIFHGCVLLFAPDRYLPIYGWGSGEFRLVRKPPIQLGKRFLGLCLSVAIIWIFTVPAVSWMLHPRPSTITYGESPLPRGVARWDLLILSAFVVTCSYFLLTRAERSVALMFAADKSRLQDKTTLRLWTIYVQLAALFFLVWSLLPLSQFVVSLR